MFELDLEFWISLGCLAVPSLLLTATLFLFIRLFRTMINPGEVKQACRESGDSEEFKDEIRYQIVCQQVNLALEKVMAGIDEQRAFIQNLIADDSPAEFKISSLSARPLLPDTAFFQPERPMSADTEVIEENRMTSQTSEALDQPSDGNPYDQIRVLIRNGLGADEIADQLGISRAEVDLFIQLRIPDAHPIDKEAVLFQATA
jgi:hypothetical protein